MTENSKQYFLMEYTKESKWKKWTETGVNNCDRTVRDGLGKIGFNYREITTENQH